MLVYDIEVFSHDTLVGVYDGKTYYQFWQEDYDELVEFYNAHKDDIWCGHNSSTYDCPLVKMILAGKQPAEIKSYSDKIVNKDANISFMLRDMGLGDIQLYDWDIMNNRVLFSLKEVEGYLGLPIEESEVDFNLTRPLTKAERELTEKYNKADLSATWEEVVPQLPNIKLLLVLIQEYNLPKSAISYTHQKLTGVILKGRKRGFKDQHAPYDINVAPIKIDNPEYHKAVEFFTDCEELNYKEKLKLNIAGIEHIVAAGGIHGARQSYQYEGEIWDVDVASYYPNMLINFNLISRSLANPNSFKEIVEKRMNIKKKVKEYTKAGREKELTATEKNMPNALKLIINTVSGAMKAKFSTIYDERNNNWMCITGQLLLIDLIEKLEPYMTLIQSNTDGIYIIPGNNPGDRDAIDAGIKEWENKTGLILEKTIGKAIYQKDVNNYVFVKSDDSVYVKGGYVGQYFNDTKGLNGCRRNCDILDEGIVNYLVYNKSPHDTVYNMENKLWKYQTIKKIGKMYRSCAYEEDGKLIKTKNRCNRIFAAKDKEKYGKLKKLKNGKENWDNIENLPDHCLIVNKDIRNLTIGDMQDQIDLEWYVNMIKKKIVDFVLDTKEKTRGKKYNLDTDWENVLKKLNRK